MLSLLPILFAPQESLDRLLKPAGVELRLQVPPMDSVLSPDRRRVFVKDSRGLTVLDVGQWIEQTDAAAPEESANLGIDCAPNSTVAFGASSARLHFGRPAPDGHFDWVRAMPLEAADAGVNGVRYYARGSLIGVCVKGVNELQIVKPGAMLRARIPVGGEPIDVVFTADRRYAAVICKPSPTEGAVALIDLRRNAQVALIPTGPEPSDVVIDKRGRIAYVGHRAGDDVSVVDLQARRVVQRVRCRPEPSADIAARPHELALSGDGKTLYAACAGANAVAVISLRGGAKVQGYVPTGWDAITVEATGADVLVLCRDVAYKVPAPTPKSLRRYTAAVRAVLRNPRVQRQLTGK